MTASKWLVAKKVVSKVFLLAGVLTATNAHAADKFKASDFFWTKGTAPHKATVIAGVNKIYREHPLCKDLDPASVALASSKSTKANPVFFVTCGQGANALNVYFSKADIQGKKQFQAAGHIDKSKAVSLCEEYATTAAMHPSTVHFSRFLDMNLTEHPNGRTNVVTTFTAKNSFNLETKHKISCLLDRAGVIEASIAEIPR